MTMPRMLDTPLHMDICKPPVQRRSVFKKPAAPGRFGIYGNGPEDSKKYYLRRVTSMDDDLLGTKRTRLKPLKFKKEKDKGKQLILAPDYVRTFRVLHGQRTYPAIIRDDDLRRIQQASQILTKEEKKKREEKFIEERCAKLEASLKRAAEIKELDDSREADRPLNDVELEAAKQAEYMREKLYNARIEEEVEVRYLNHMLGEATKTFILGRQIEANKKINQAIEEDEKRIDDLMDKERQEALKRQEEREAREKEMKKKYGELLLSQIKDNEINKLIEEEKNVEEQKLQMMQMVELMKEDLEEMKKKKEKQRQMKEGLDMGLCDYTRRLAEEKYRNQLVDEEVKAVVAAKDEQEKELEDEKKHIRKLKQIELDRVIHAFEVAKKLKDEQEELKIKREEEANERKWRLKQKEDDDEKFQKMKNLAKVQAEQLAAKERLLAYQLQQERDDFCRVIQQEKEALEVEKFRENQIKQANKVWSEEVKNQIVQSEQAKIKERIGYFKEGEAFRKEKQRKVEELQKVKQQKLAQIRERCSGIPAYYLDFIDKKVKIVEPPKLEFAQHKAYKFVDR